MSSDSHLFILYVCCVYVTVSAAKAVGSFAYFFVYNKIMFINLAHAGARLQYFCLRVKRRFYITTAAWCTLTPRRHVILSIVGARFAVVLFSTGHNTGRTTIEANVYHIRRCHC